MKPLRVLISLLLLLPVNQLIGQGISEKNFARYTTAEGMSHNTVVDIAQDSAGYIWIATASGLNRYDGGRFIQFHSDRDSLSLAAEELSGMVWLNKSQLAIYTIGLHVIDTKTGMRRNIFIPYHDQQFQYKFNTIMGAVGDNNGNIYILTRSGFYHYDKDYKLVSRFDYYREKDLDKTHFHFGGQLFELDSRRLFMVTEGGLYIYDKEKRQVKKMTADDCPIMTEFLNYPVQGFSFFQPKAGILFILKPESDSLVYIDVNKNKKVVSRLPINPLWNEFSWRSRLIPINDTIFFITSHYSGFYKIRVYPETGFVKLFPEKYFASYFCSSVLKDKNNHLWVGTNKGLFREDPEKLLVEVGTLPVGIEDSFPNMKLGDIYVSPHEVYVGARGEGGLMLFDKKTLQFEKQLIFDKIDRRNNTINAIVSLSPSTLMLGTNSLLFLFDQSTKTAKRLIPPRWDVNDWTNDLLKDSKGTIWVSDMNLYRYSPRAKNFSLVTINGRSLTVPVGLREDKNGQIWMASHGLARYNADLNKLDLVIDSFPFIKMPDKQVSVPVIDQQNTAWFASNNNGLLAYNINQRTFRIFTAGDGLPDNNIVSMMIIANKLWIACYSGVACMDLRTSKIIRFGKEDGFPDAPVVKGAKFFYDSTEHQLYMSFSNAITRFNPFEILRNKLSPDVFIENVAINGEKNNFLPGGRLTTSWRDNEMMVTIGSINFLDGHSQGFAYRILKENSIVPWQQLGNQPSFSISNLSPGNYKIQVKAFSLNNRWPEQVKEISIVVLPPFWKADWFIILMSIFVLVLLYLFIKWRTGLARKKEMEKTQIEKLKADDYKNQFELEQISNYFSSSLVGKNTVEEVLWDVTHNLIGRMNYEDCMIYLWNEDKTKMVQKAAYGPKGRPEFISAQVFEVLPGQGIVGHAIRTRQPVLVKDTRMDDRYRVDDAFRLSEVCVPIIHNDELLGILDSEHRLPDYFSERDIKMLTTITTLLGNKLKQIEADQSLRAKREELANINEQLAEARLAALQAQMNPHFVFNALNSIKRMILECDNEKASRYLSKFAQMIRLTLNHSKEVFIMLDENIEYLKAYLEMEQLRFDDSFNYSIYTSENIDLAETPIPSMMIQPLVENAIWHGLMASKTEKKLLIGFTQRENKIICTVEDNGIGISQSQKLKDKNNNPHHSIGLENLQKRIKIMNEKYDMGCSLRITDLNGTGKNRSGTKVTLELNLINV